MVFALGIVFWEILTGQRLFRAKTTEDDAARSRMQRAACQSSINPKLPKELDARLVLKALAKSRRIRYEDAQAFRMAIEDFAIASACPPAASHLVAVMRGLYADRIALDESSFDELTADAVLG